MGVASNDGGELCTSLKHGDLVCDRAGTQFDDSQAEVKNGGEGEGREEVGVR